MQVNYTPLNADNTYNSLAISVEDGSNRSTVIIDAGPGIDTSNIEMDSVDGLALTHSHHDHIAELSEFADGELPVYASETTAGVLNEVFNAALTTDPFIQSSYNEPVVTRFTEEHRDALKDQLITLPNDWLAISQYISLYPLPAGHVPGAVSYLIEISNPDTKDDPTRALVTGGFSLTPLPTEDAFPAEMVGELPIDLLIMNTTSEPGKLSDKRTESVFDLVEYATSGVTTGLRTTSLHAIEYADYFEHLLESQIIRQDIDVCIIGMSARIAESTRSYDNVSVISEYSLTPVCEQHDIVISAPAFGSSASGAAIERILTEMPNGKVITAAPFNNESDDTTQKPHYHLKTHPTEAEIDAIVNDIDPGIIVPYHGDIDPYKDRYDYTMYISAFKNQTYNVTKDGKLEANPWVESSVAQTVKLYHSSSTNTRSLQSYDLPPESHNQPQLSKATLDLDRIKSRFA